MLLIPDPRPLDERLGKSFFRDAPARAGVYVMRDAEEKVLYVGKAKDLRQRLRHYRIANPDRMPRRHLRMVRAVTRIDFEFCEDESAALRRESELLRSLKPVFNRAGVWPGKARFFVWRWTEEALKLGVVDVPEIGWERFGPLGGGAHSLHGALARLLWLALNPRRTVVELPAGWARGEMPGLASIQCGNASAEVGRVLAALFWEAPEVFAAWLAERIGVPTHPFERAILEEDLTAVTEFSARLARSGKHRQQLALL
jgi:predicted GIY-YIG superfamily endonuclease